MAVRKSKAEQSPEPLLQALPEEVWRDVFGLTKRADRDWANRIVGALQKIDRGLVPPMASHPYEALIAQGSSALPQLLSLLEQGTEREWFDALDATAHICLAIVSGDADGAVVDDKVIARLRAQLKRHDLTPEQQALVAKTLAIARDHGVLHEQLHRLADPDPGVVAAAARLLGLGRYRPAARVLRELVSPERFYESRAVIWALGEIGDPEVLPALSRALSQSFRVVDCLIAIGKIGQVTSVGLLLPMIVAGAPEQKDAAVRALAMVLDHHRQDGAVLSELFASLVTLIESQLASEHALSGSTRFFMLLCLARLGHPLDEARVRRYLRLGLDDDDAGAVTRALRPRGR
jgi:hypothetical protein